jgi:hypothetical protein
MEFIDGGAWRRVFNAGRPVPGRYRRDKERRPRLTLAVYTELGTVVSPPHESERPASLGARDRGKSGPKRHAATSCRVRSRRTKA